MDVVTGEGPDVVVQPLPEPVTKSTVKVPDHAPAVTLIRLAAPSTVTVQLDGDTAAPALAVEHVVLMEPVGWIRTIAALLLIQAVGPSALGQTIHSPTNDDGVKATRSSGLTAGKPSLVSRALAPAVFNRADTPVAGRFL